MSVFQGLIWAENKMDTQITNDSKLPKGLHWGNSFDEIYFYNIKFTQVKYIIQWFYSQNSAAIIVIKFRAHYLSYKTSPVFFAVNLHSVCSYTYMLKHMHSGMQTQVCAPVHTHTQTHPTCTHSLGSS